MNRSGGSNYPSWSGPCVTARADANLLQIPGSAEGSHGHPTINCQYMACWQYFSIIWNHSSFCVYHGCHCQNRKNRWLEFHYINQKMAVWFGIFYWSPRIAVILLIHWWDRTSDTSTPCAHWLIMSGILLLISYGIGLKVLLVSNRNTI